MTHINAFYMAVDEAKAELQAANGKLEAAEAALHEQPGYEAEVAAGKKSAAAHKRDEKGHFVKEIPVTEPEETPVAVEVEDPAIVADEPTTKSE